MRPHRLVFAPVCALLCALIAFALVVCAATSASAAPGPYHPPRNVFGQPDLEGNWSGDFAVPLERDDTAFRTLEVPEAQARAWEAAHNDKDRYYADLQKQNPKANLGFIDPDYDVYVFRLPRIDGVARSSVIVDPADGKLPWRPQGKARLAALLAGVRGLANPEQRFTVDRCLTGYAQGPPFSPGFPFALMQIVQTRDAVVIRTEDTHDLRIIPLASAHGPVGLRPWYGDEIARYEGDTLVIETVRLHPAQELRETNTDFLLSAEAVVVERFRRVSADEVRYSYEVSDPVNYTRVWRGEAPLARGGPLQDDACHEGDYDTAATLAGARKVEADRAAAIAAFARDLAALRTPPSPARWPGPRPAPGTARAAGR